MKPTLVILAAGLGSRYGNLKQLDGFGPNGELLLEYTIFDAIRAGFGKIVFVIRESMADEFRSIIQPKLETKIDFDFTIQDVSRLPGDCVPNPNRTKPWGTGHALWAASHLVDTAFCMVNADDFYGLDALSKMKSLLVKFTDSEKQGGMIGYPLVKTLSEHGTVSRGICDVDNGRLLNIQEHTKITKTQSGIVSLINGKEIQLDDEAIASMNLMGFSYSVLTTIEEEFKEFYALNSESNSAEFYAPLILQKLIDDGADVKVEVTSSNWFGVTYADDKPRVEAEIKKLSDENKYPNKLWD